MRITRGNPVPVLNFDDIAVVGTMGYLQNKPVCGGNNLFSGLDAMSMPL